MDRLDTLLTNTDAFSCRSSELMNRILRKDSEGAKVICLDLSSGASLGVAEVIEQYVMHYLFYHNLGGNIRGGLQYLLCCDEANMLIRTDKEWLGPSPLDDLIRQAREYGLGFWLCAQEYRPLSQTIKANVYSQVMLNISDAEDFDRMARAFQLTHEERNSAWKLSIGEAIVRLADRYRNPFPIEIALISGTDAAQTSFPDLSYVPVEEDLRNRVFDLIFGETKTMAERQAQQEDSDETKIMALCVDIMNHPLDALGQREKRLKFGSTSAVGKVKDLASGNQLILEFQLKLTPGRGSSGLYLALTDKAVEHLKRKRLYKKKAVGKGGPLHQILAQYVKSVYEQKGYQAVIECEENRGWNADVGVCERDSGTKVVAVEISHKTDETEVKNILRDSEIWPEVEVIAVDTKKSKNGVVVVDEAASQRKVRKLQDLLKDVLSFQEQDEMLRRVSFRTLSQFRRAHQ